MAWYDVITDPIQKEWERIKEDIATAGTGAAIGAGVGGPFGAVIGAVGGGAYSRISNHGIGGLIPFGLGDELPGAGFGGDGDGNMRMAPPLSTPGLQYLDAEGNARTGLLPDDYTYLPWLDEQSYRARTYADLARANQRGWQQYYDKQSDLAPQANYLGANLNLAQQFKQAGQIAGLSDEFGNIATGQAGPSPVELQLRAAAENAGAEQYGRAASASASNRAAAYREAAENAADMQFKANREAAVQRATEIQNARANQLAASQAAGSMYGDIGAQYAGMSQFNAAQEKDWRLGMDEALRNQYQYLGDNALTYEDMLNQANAARTGAQWRQKDTELATYWRPYEIDAGIRAAQVGADAQQNAALIGGGSQIAASFLANRGAK